MGLTIEWLGHCAFRLVRDDGLSVLIDPFCESIGFDVPKYDCDILLASHWHYDSNATHLVPRMHDLIHKEGITKKGDIEVEAIPWWHDDQEGRDFGSVLIFTFELGGFRIGYLSHIGSIPEQSVLEKLRNLDICFLPVGGMFALGPSEARQIVNEIAPQIVIPMHFDTSHQSFDLLPLTEFTSLMPKITEVLDWRVPIRKDQLSGSPTVLKMHHWPG